MRHLHAKNATHRSNQLIKSKLQPLKKSLNARQN